MPTFDPFTCPATANLSAIAAGSCMPHLEQTIGFYFQKEQASYTVTPSSALLQATWTDLFAASDGTKVTKSPQIVNLTIAKSEGTYAGGNDNTTPGGLPLYKGEGPVRVSFMIRTSKVAMIESLRGYIPYTVPAGSSTLQVFLIGRNKRISGITASSKLVGIPIHNLRISSVGNEGLKSFNEYDCAFDLAEGWDEGLTTVQATDFDPAKLLLTA